MTLRVKRVWIRRWNRAGWLLTFPFRQPWKAFWIVLGTILVLWAGTAFKNIYDEAAPASSELLVAESKADSCFAHTMKLRVLQWKRPAKISDVRDLKDECLTFLKNEVIVQEQMRVLQNQLEVLK